MKEKIEVIPSKEIITDEMIDRWEQIPTVMEFLTCRMMGAWLERRDLNIANHNVKDVGITNG